MNRQTFKRNGINFTEWMARYRTEVARLQELDPDAILTVPAGAHCPLQVLPIPI